MLSHYLKRGAHNSLFYALGSGITRLISFFLLPYFLTTLSLTDFGIWDFYQSFFSLGTLILSSCTAIALTRFYLLYNDNPFKQQQAIGNALLVVVVSSGLFCLGMLAALYLHLMSWSSHYVVITLSNCVTCALFSVLLAYLRVQERRVLYVVLFCSQNLVALGLTVLGVMKGYGINAFFYANAISLLLFVPCFLVLFLRYRTYSWSLLKAQASYSVPLLAYSFIYTGFFTIDRFFIKQALGYEVMGIHGLLWRFGSIFQFIAIALMDAWPLVLFNAHKEPTRDTLLPPLTTYLCVIHSTLWLGVMVAARCAVVWFFPLKYHVVLAYLPLFFTFVLLLEIAKVFQSGFGLSAQTWYTPLLTSLAVTVQAVLLYVTSSYGLDAVFMTNLVILACYALANYSMSVRVYSAPLFDGVRLMQLGLCGILYGGLLQLFTFLQFSWWYWVALLMTWPLMLWFMLVTEEEKTACFAWLGFRTSSPTSSTILYLRTDQCFTEITAGGSVAHTVGVINGFKELGYTVLCASSGLQSTLRALNLPYFKELKMPPLFFFLCWKLGHLRWRLECFFANFFFMLQLLPLLRKHTFRFIYQRYSLLNGVGIILSKITNIPLVLEYNGSEVWVFSRWSEHHLFHLTWLCTWVEKRVLAHARYIVVVSQSLKDELIMHGVPAHNILVNPNGVDTRLFDAQVLHNERAMIRAELNLEDRLVFGFIGTFSYWHGIEMLAQIIPAVVKKNPRIHFLLIGNGPLKKYLVDAVEHAKVQVYVTCTGLIVQQEAKKYLAACDAFLSPTQPNPDGTPFFGSPTKIFEYMSMAKPVIASKLGQINELLAPALTIDALVEHKIENQVGILVEPTDVQGFIKAIEKVAAMTHKQRMLLGHYARQKAIGNYSWQKHVEAITTFIKKN
jgi:glycosyltransferase involved in cell wall biosynthesis/O-antigen/teichoic acid export membrane protein